jgi:integrase
MGHQSELGLRPGQPSSQIAGVRRASQSSIEIDFYYRGIRCRERIEKPPTPTNLAAGARLKAAVEQEIAEGVFDYLKRFPNSRRARKFAETTSTLTTEDYLNAWLQRESRSIAPSTRVSYQKTLDYHLIPTFGSVPLAELRRSHLYAWTDLHPELSMKTIKNILSPFRIALRAAVRRDLILTSPFNDFKLERHIPEARHKFGRKSESLDPFSAEERTAILRVLIDPIAYNLVLFAFWTGLRTSELIGLNWTEIDWIRGVVRVSQRLTQGMAEPERGTKTEAGSREVKLLGPALQALTAQKAHTFMAGGVVFEHPRQGGRWTDETIRMGFWTSALKRAGVRYRPPYQTRHTYATMMLMAGENVLWVAQQMGHKDWSLTAKRYSRWIPSDQPEAGSKAEAAWSAFSQHRLISG